MSNDTPSAEATFNATPPCADGAELVPGTERTTGTTTAYEAQEPAALIRVVQAWTKLAGTTMV